MGKRQDEVKDVGKAECIIVDGQQRLTAIWLVLRGEIKICFDLEKAEFIASEQGQNALRLDILNGRDFNAALNSNFFFVNASENQQRTFAAALTRLNSFFTNTKIPYQLVKNTDYNTVVEIFNQLNQQGVPLTDGQIALATISKLWKGVFKRTFDLMKKVNMELNYVKNEEPDLIIQAWTAVHTGQHLIRNLAPTATKSRYIKFAKEELYKESWEKIEPAFLRAIDILKNRFDLTNYQFIPGFYPLIVVVNYLANHPACTDDEILQLSKWFIQSMVRSRYANRSTSKLRDDVYATKPDKKISDLFSHAWALNPHEFQLSKEDILGASFKSSFSTLLYILMRKAGATDFLNNEEGKKVKVGEILPNNQAWQYHHVFPDSKMKEILGGIEARIEEAELNGTDDDLEKLQKEYKTLKESIWSIPNLAFLTPASNQCLSASKPSEYLADILKKPNGKEILEAQFVPLDPSLWVVNRFEDFRKARAQLILDKTTQYLKSEGLI
jgi:hypothetical protein